ncbi:hypothetical protein ACIO87_31655 [Streptomyces sp. NPDC087218]
MPDKPAGREAVRAEGPRGGDPLPGQGLYTVTDVMSLQQDMVGLFGPIDA